jgi:hypothetical protein
MGIIQSLRKREGRKPHARATVKMVPRRSAETPPQLMLLLPDAASVAAYQLNQFPSAKAAEFFQDSSLRGSGPKGSVMFWALTWQPTADAATEPLVLIRDTSKPIVYPFSFSDIDSAFEFVRHEMHRGLHLSQVMIYWAVPAHIEVDFWGRSTIQPAEPPASLTVISTSFAEPVFSSDAAIKTVTSPSPAIEGQGAHYLADDDIAETVRQAEQAASKSPQPAAPVADGRVVPMPVPGPSSRKSKKQKTTEGSPLIDFPSASQKVQEGRLARAAITAWRNFSLAVDEALDVYVARQVTTKLAWNRITRALGQAMDVRKQTEIEAAERKALEEAEEARRETALAEEARQAAARAAAKQATAKEAAKRHALTLASQNGATALSESAHIVCRRATIADSWANATVAIAAAAGSVNAAKVMRKAWLNAAWTLEEAAFAYALEAKSRAIRAWRFATLGIAEAAEEHIAREKALRLAWLNACRAIGEAHRVSIARRRMFEEAWSESATQIRAAVLAWRRLIRARTALNNFSMAIEEALEAKAYREEMIHAWDAIINGVLSAAAAKHCSDRAITAWGNIAFALEAVGRAKIARDAAIGAWANGSLAIGEMLHAFLVQRTLIRFWQNAGRAFAEAVAVHLFKQQSIAGWTTASISIKAALVADALLRINQAGLDKEHMSGVEKAVKVTVTRAQTRTKKTAKAGKGTRGKKALAAAAIEEVEAEVTPAPPPLLIGDVKLPEQFLPDEMDEVAEEVILETIPPLEGEFAEALLAAVDAVNLDDDEEPFDEETPDEQVHKPVFPGLWRGRDAGRWQPPEEPFKGFESPRGRF